MKSDMDNREWGDEEMSLKRFTKNNPFMVPSAYFEEAGQRILSLAKLDELKSTDPANGFTVPANYFDELTGNVTGRINIGVEADAAHNGFALPSNYFDQLTANINSRINIEMAEATEDNGFALPANYFEQLSNNITSRINIEAEADEDMGYALPAGYFDKLTSKIESRIAVEELANSEESFAVPEGYFDDMQQQIAARIAVEEILAEKTTGFTVPDNYFELLNRNILNKTVNKEVVIRKTIIRKLFASNSFKYATAACLALVIGTGVILQQNGTTVIVPESSVHQNTLLHSALANVPVDEIKDYLEQNVDAGDASGMIQDDKQINTKALSDDLSDYIDAN